MFNWDFAKKIFDGFMILRWTDFLRPTEFVQMEKSAAQSILTYLIGKEYEKRNPKKSLDWEYIVDSNIYGFLCKIATSDIKATISKKLKEDYLPYLIKFVDGVYFGKKGKNIFPVAIDKKKLHAYIKRPKKKDKALHSVENEICFIAHKYATYCEFQKIEQLNYFSPDRERVKNDLSIEGIKREVSDPILKGIVTEFGESAQNLTIVFAYFEKLRPQIRWSQTCRVPQTTVLGHSMYVAILTYFAIKDLQIQRDPVRYLVNSFYCALFHDLPESLTRDIISPVKIKINGFDTELSYFEYTEVREKIISKIGAGSWGCDLLDLLGDTGENRFVYSKNRGFILGNLVKKMDLLAAFMEAKMSVEMGIDSDALQQGIKFTENALLNKEEAILPADLECEHPIDFAEFFASIPQYKQGV